MTGSTGFQVTPDSYQPFNRGSNDAFISKLGNSYTISGRVLNNGNADSPLSGAEVVLSDGTPLVSVFTGGDGTYQFSRLREEGNYTISASLPHFTLTPASQAFSNLNSDQVLDFSALTSDAEFHTISGQVAENGVPLPSVTVTLSGSQSGLRTTDSNGHYSFTLIAGGNYTVTPSAVGFSFDPASQTFNALNANPNRKFRRHTPELCGDKRQQSWFTMSSIAAIEDVGTLPVTVLRTGGTTGSLTVDYATANGTAIAGQDYTSTLRHVEFRCR